MAGRKATTPGPDEKSSGPDLSNLDPSEEEPKAKPRRGRPPGSKTKAKAKKAEPTFDIPPEMLGRVVGAAYGAVAQFSTHPDLWYLTEEEVKQEGLMLKPVVERYLPDFLEKYGEIAVFLGANFLMIFARMETVNAAQAKDEKEAADAEAAAES